MKYKLIEKLQLIIYGILQFKLMDRGRQKRQQEAKRFKDFKNMRRTQVKEFKTEGTVIDKFNLLILNQSSQQLLQQFRQQKSEFVFNYLISQNEYLKTPIKIMFEQTKWKEFLSIINDWSCDQQISPFLIEKLDYFCQTPEHLRVMKNRFQEIVRCICAIKGQDYQDSVRIFSQKETYFALIMKFFLSYENLVGLIPESLHLDLFERVFSKISLNLQLDQSTDLCKFAMLKKRQKIWNQKSFISAINYPELLILKELNFNFVHQLIDKNNEKLFHQVLDYFIEQQQTTCTHQTDSQVKQNYFSYFDGSGDIPLDILLSRWSFSSIQKVLTKIKLLQFIRFSINSLNKIISNKLLTQKQVQSLMEQALNGEVADKGYCQRVIKQKMIKTKPYKGIIKIPSKQYVVVLDKRKLLMAKDNRQSYPLLNYLNRFQTTSSLKIISVLFFQGLDRKVVKPKVISLLKKIGTKCTQLNSQNQALNEVDDIIYYHQSLLESICRLPHNDVLQFFVDKLFINYFTISIWSKTDGKPVLHAVNKHFFTYYINVHQNLKQNNLNKKILDKIFEAKDNEKNVNDFNMYVELLRQLTQYKTIYNKDQWLVLKIKEKLKEYVKGLQNHIFIEIFSYLNQGEQQQKIFLIDLINPILSQQQISQLNLPWLPKNEQEKKKGRKKKINYVNGSPHQKIKQYPHNKLIQNFSVELKLKIKVFTENMQKWQQQQKIKKQKKEAFKDNYQQVEKVMMPELQWLLQLDEPDLEKKLKDLINQGCTIYFKLNKTLPNNNPISKSKQQKVSKSKTFAPSIVQKYIQNIQEPYKAIIKCAVFNKFYSGRNKDRSLEFHIALLFCQDEDAPLIFKFLKESSPKFQKILCDWENIIFKQREVNPLLLKQIVKEKKMRQIYKLDEQQLIQKIVQNMRLGINKILCDIKSDKIPKNHIQKMISYREIIQEIKQTESLRGSIYEYLTLHSSKVDLSPFYKQITIKEIFQKQLFSVFANKLSFSQDPIKQLLQVRSLLAQTFSKLEVESKKIFPKPITKQQRDYQEIEQQEKQFRYLKSKAQNGLLFKVLTHNKLHHLYMREVRQIQKKTDIYVRILDSLSMENFQLYLKSYQVCTYSKCKFLISRLKDEKKCIKVFDNLIRANNQIKNQSQILKQKETLQILELYDYLHPSNLKFSNNIPSFIQTKFDTFNAILCAFLKADQYVALRTSNPPSGKITVEKNYFIDKLNFQTYKIYIQYIGKMLLIENENYTLLQKQAIIFNIFTTFVNTENWMKAIKLIEKIIQLRPLLKNTINKKQQYEKQKRAKKEQQTQKQEQIEEEKQGNLVELFIKHALDLCSKNKKRVSNFKNVQEYQNLIKILFKLLSQQKSNADEEIFQSAWMVSPEQTVKAIQLETITLLTLAKCLNAYPSKVKLIQYISLNEDKLPQKYRPKIEGNFLPFSLYTAQEIEKQPSLIDLMIFEQKIRQKWKYLKPDINSYCHVFDNKKKAVFLHKLVMKRYKQVYSKEQILSFSSQIFNSNGLESLKEIPKEYIDSYFTKHTEIRGISSFKQNLIKELIDMGYIKKQYILDIIKSSRMSVVDYLFTKLNLKFDYQNIQSMQKQSRIKSSFIQVLLNLENQKFAIQFIKKFNVFQLYPEARFEQMTKDVLWGIALLHRTQLLRQFLTYLSAKLKSAQLVFKEAPVPEQYSQEQGFVPKEMQNSGVRDGFIYLPLRIAQSNNFYEYYFLMRQSGAHECKFTSSNRFFSNCNPDHYDFIPEMKKRLSMLKLFYQYFSGSKNKIQIYKNVLLPSTLDLKLVEYKGNAKDDLPQFIRCIAKQEIFIKKDGNKQYGNRFLIILLMKTLPDTQISDDDLSKFYVEETPLVAYVLKNFKLKVHGHENIDELIRFHDYLRKLLYTLNPKYLKQCKQPLSQWAFQYSNPFALQIRYFEQPQNGEFRKRYIYECFFKQTEIQVNQKMQVVKPFRYYYNDQMMIDILISCLVSKYEGNQSALHQFCEFAQRSQEQLLLDLSLHICTLKTIKAQIPIEEGNFIHNPKVWDKIYEELKKVEKIKKFTKKTEFKPFFNQHQNYTKLLNYDANEQLLKKSSSGTLDIYACFSYLNNLLYLIGYQKQLQKQLSDNSTEYNSEEYSLSLVLMEEKEKFYKIIDMQDQKKLQIMIPFKIEDNLPLKQLRIETAPIKQKIEKLLMLKNIRISPNILEEEQCLSKLNFVLDIDSILKIESLGLLKKIITQTHNLSNCLKSMIENLNNSIQEVKDTKVYSLGDVYGPVVINDETDKNKVIECLSFYEMCKLPNMTITCKYIKSEKELVRKNLTILSDIKQYIKFFKFQINDDQQENKEGYKFNSVVWITQKANQQDSYKIILDQFYVYNIVRFIEKVGRQGQLISSTFNNQILCKYSISSIIKLIQVQMGTDSKESSSVLQFIDEFVGGRNNIKFIESILIMILEDANNIMKVVKGILIIYNYKQKYELSPNKQLYKISQFFSCYGLSYQIDDQIFKITINVCPTTKQLKQIQPFDTNIISRKEFLNTVFSSTQFLTGYFINKTTLANELVKISKQIGQTVNSVVNFSINYNEIYNFIQNIKENVTIKEIDGLLTNLNHHINGNYKKYVQNYLSSKQLGIQHQVTLISYFESLYKKIIKNNGGSYNTKEQYKFGTHADNSNGISQIYNFSTELKSSNSKEINIKNMYLIQIYKNYFVSIVRQGMSVILGYKTNRPPRVLELKKKEDINNVNVTEISFLLIISNRLPTKDEINYEKIIKIFVSDLNENIYEINKELSLKLLELPEESDERILAHAVPVIQSNVILVFKSDYSKKQITNQQDDNNHKYFEISLNLAGKNKIISKNKIQVSCMDMLKIDPQFNTSIKSLTINIKSILKQNINITLKIPKQITGKSLQPTRISEVFMFGFIDFQQVLSNIFAESTRNKDLELYTSVMRGKEISENILGKEKRKIFQDFYDSITFEIQDDTDGKIKIDGKNIKIIYTYKISNEKNINVTTICDTILKDMIQKLLKKGQKIKSVYDVQLNQNKQKQGSDYLAILQYLLISKYQTQVIEQSIDIAKKIGKAKKNIKGYSVRLRSEEKTFMKYDKQNLIFNIRLRTPFREFIPSDKILQFIFNGFMEVMEGLISTKYNPQNQTIQLFNYDSVSPLEMVVVGKQKVECKQIKINNDGNLKKSTYEFNNSNNYLNYYLLQKEGEICYVASNYFWTIDKNIPYLSEKKNIGVSKNKFSLLLVSPFPINMNQCTINLSVHEAKNEKANDTINVIKKTPQVETQITLLSKEILKLELTPLVSATINVMFGKFRLYSNGLQSLSIVSTSGKQMVQENTKFVQLIFRNKVFKPQLSDLQKREQNLPFIEPAEKVNLNQKLDKKQKNVEDMVYIVNENAKKFLTRAGEVRVDVINVCDDEGNPINFNPETKIYFRHLNILSQIIQPEIKYENDNVRVELSWSPKVRGPYEIFLNSTRLNPNYEIGVMAAVADIKNLKIQYPKKTEICFAEQTQCSILLKDNFGNIYTQLQEAFISDSLIINIISSDVDQSIIKLKAQKIDKYGLKKIRFSFDDPTGSDEKNVKAFLQINMENVAEFNLKIKGQSLAQRRKRLEKDMEGATKRYYTDVTVSRNNFIQSLFKIADKSLDKNFSIKFAGQQGIDAGGLKRQFYDMIGKQLKNPQNPFFIQTDASRHNEYFLNQQILKNKKKLEYMNLFGQYLANSLINGYLIGINFSNTFVKMLYEDPITFDDMLSVLSKEQASRYEYLIKADADYIDDLQIYFSCVLNRKKGTEVQMIENGKNIKVTKDNINQYLKLLPDFLITERYKEIMDSFRKGFESVLKIQIVRRWIRSDQFWCLTAGVKEITPEVVLSYVVIRGGKETHHAWFRAYITEASKQILQGFLKFSSGSSSIDFYQNSKISVVFENQGENTKKLPISHTCWKQIDIPAYKTYAVMKQLLNAAFLYCSQGFGFG